MGSCCGKESLKSSPSNSFTNLKFPASGERKQSTKSNGVRSRQKSGDSVKSKKSDKSPAAKPTAAPRKSLTRAENLPNSYNHSTNNVRHSEHKPPSPAVRRQENLDEEGRTPSYRLRQADLRGKLDGGDGSDGSKQNSIDRSTPTSQINNDRAGSIRREQQLITGHRRTGSTDLMKRGHARTGSNANQGMRDRADSQKRIQADFIRKGSWTLNEPKLTRGDSHDKKEYSPVLVRTNSNGRRIQNNSHPQSQPSILVDHCVDQKNQTNSSPQKSSIPQPTSPSMTRSDSCKNELNPVLRNKSHLQERRQVVSAITIDTNACNGTASTDSGSNDSRPHSGDFTTAQHIPNGKDLDSQLQLNGVIKWKKGNLLGRGTFGKVSLMHLFYNIYFVCISFNHYSE